MRLDIQIKFAQIYSNFSKDTHSLKDISDIISEIRFNRKEISNEAKRCMLQIPLNVLENQCTIKDETNWKKKQGDYFAGNFKQLPFNSIFNSQEFDLQTIVDSLKTISADDSLLNSDFHLRNPEVTLREDVEVETYSKFRESGGIYKRIMERAFDL